MKQKIVELKKDLKKLSSKEKTKTLSRFFKTGKGEYGEGDVFLGLKSADIKDAARKYFDLSLAEIQKLLEEKTHEYRSVALSILWRQFKKGGPKARGKIYRFYLRNTTRVNNWDLVDGSAPTIVGEYLIDHPKEKEALYQLAKSNNLWERRISIMATFPFIKDRNFKETFKIAKILLNDQQDLIHKAVGWLLREIGKINQKEEERFLKKYYRKMPRTMLRYAIEKFSPEKRAFYMKKD